jgi:hypothetical protein
MGVGLPKSLYKKKDMQESINNALSSFLKEQAEQNKGSFDMVKPQDGELVVKGQLPATAFQNSGN